MAPNPRGQLHNMLATQTLGEEYTDIWQHSAFTERAPTARARACLILLSTLPSYIVARLGSRLDSLPQKLSSLLRALPIYIEVATDLNLAIFYLKGSYHDLIKRVLGIRHVRISFNILHSKTDNRVVVIHPREPARPTTLLFPARSPHPRSPVLQAPDIRSLGSLAPANERQGSGVIQGQRTVHRRSTCIVSLGIRRPRSRAGTTRGGR